jgi:hypothetical protein
MSANGLGNAEVNSKVYYALLLKLFEKAADVGGDAHRITRPIFCLQRFDDFLHGALAVAVLENVASGAAQADCALGEKQSSLLALGFRPSAAGR